MLGLATTLQAQNSELSPTSISGYGDPAAQGTARQAGMGGILSANIENNRYTHASAASITTANYFQFQLAFVGEQRSFSLNSSNNFNNRRVGISYVSVLLPLDTSIGFGIALGAKPYSSSDYFSSSEITSPLHGRETYYQNGGLSSAFAQTGVRLFRQLSLGMGANYTFGKNQIIHTLDFEDSTKAFDIKRETGLSRRGVGAHLAARFDFNIDSTHFQISGIYESGLKFKTGSHVTSYLAGQGFVLADSIERGVSSSYSEYTPNTITAGLSIRTKHNLMIAAEYGITNTSRQLENGLTAFKGGYTAALGLQWVPDSSGRKFFNKLTYRAGARYSVLPWTYKGMELADMRFTLGFGIPLPGYKTPYSKSNFIDIALEAGRTNDIQGSGAAYKKSYIGFTAAMSIIETGWFKKRKLD